MQVMIWTELKKLRRSRMLLVALFGLCMVLVIVTAQGFFAGGNEAYGMEPEWYLTGVQSLGTMYALPGIIALFGSYIICRESQEDVLIISIFINFIFRRGRKTYKRSIKICKNVFIFIIN